MKHHATLCNEWIEMDRRAIERLRQIRNGLAYGTVISAAFAVGVWCGWLAGVLHASRAMMQ